MGKEEEPPNPIFFSFLHHHLQHHNNLVSSTRRRHSNIINKNSTMFSSISDNHSNSNSIDVYCEEGIVLIIVMLVLFISLVFIACKFKPWRYLFDASRFRTIKADDLERPLVSEDSSPFSTQGNDFARTHDREVVGHQSQEGFSSPQGHGLAPKQKVPSSLPQLTHSGSFILDILDSSEAALVDQTLRRHLLTNWSADEQELGRKKEIEYSSRFDIHDERSREFVSKYTGVRGSILMLEVIAGPSRGLQYSILSTNASRLPVTLGRVSPSDILLKDPEVSGKHAHIDWNINKLKWELVDLGSLNGTHLNSKAVHCPHQGSRQRGDPVEISSGDVITLGTTSKIFIQITLDTDMQLPFGVGVASDPMALRRGGKKLPMEDVCYFKWPVPGTEQFGLFGLCDGHGGTDAAISVSKIMPEMITKILSDSYIRGQVLTRSDASDVLREAFSQTEACIDNYYEGCTATVLLLWADGQRNFFLQCANVGDSTCFIDIDGNLIKMTEDHRVTSYSERSRFQAAGQPLREGATRLCGLNLARVLGDKFLKEQDARFSSEPFISEVVCIPQASQAFALLASDGFWDVINVKRAVQLVREEKEKHSNGKEDSAERVANLLLNEARIQRTKDNTSIMFLDFDSNRTHFCKLHP